MSLVLNNWAQNVNSKCPTIEVFAVLLFSLQLFSCYHWLKHTKSTKSLYKLQEKINFVLCFILLLNRNILFPKLGG